MKLLAVVVLAVVLAVSLFSPVAGQTEYGRITITKVTTNGDTTTAFHFTVLRPDKVLEEGDLVGGESKSGGAPYLLIGDYTVIEKVPPGWVLTDVTCEGSIKTPKPSTFEYLPGEGVVITYVEADHVVCTFTNSPVSPPVGGVVIPVNTLALVSPWLAVIGLVGCIGAVVVVARKRQKDGGQRT